METGAGCTSAVGALCADRDSSTTTEDAPPEGSVAAQDADASGGDEAPDDVEAGSDAEARSDVECIGLSCACATEGEWFCERVGTGYECKNHRWEEFQDGPCWPTFEDHACDDPIVGCTCHFYDQRICSSGNGIECKRYSGRWELVNDGACTDGGSDGSTDAWPVDG
jgi:hypothetical protein